ncbi:MAG: SDR family NAD(P)-dependent oxidoreductase [Bryobacteraceae bacterium]
MQWRGTALVTGASSGLGEEFALQLAQRGCDLIVVARRANRLDSLCEKIRGVHNRKAVSIVADLSADKGVDHLLKELNRSGVLPDYLVNNAGRGHYGAAVDTPVETNRHMMRLNMDALTTLSVELGRKMVKRGAGAIMNVASAVAYQPAPYFSVYAATKAYVLSFSEALAAEVSGSGVRVFTICPGATESEFASRAGMSGVPMSLTTSAKDCVRRSLNAFEGGSLTYIDGPLNTASVLFARFVPRSFIARAIAIAAQK